MSKARSPNQLPGDGKPAQQGRGPGLVVEPSLYIGDVVEATVTEVHDEGLLVKLVNYGGRSAYLGVAEISRRRSGSLANKVLANMLGSTLLVKVTALSDKGVDVSKTEVTSQEKRLHRKLVKRAKRLENKVAWLAKVSGKPLAEIIELVGTRIPEAVDERLAEIAKNEDHELAPFLRSYLDETPKIFVEGVLRNATRSNLKVSDLQVSLRLEIFSFWKTAQCSAAEMAAALTQVVANSNERGKLLLGNLIKPVLQSNKYCLLETLYLLEEIYSKGIMGMEEFLSAVKVLRSAQLLQELTYEEWKANSYLDYEEGIVNVRDEL